MVEFLDGVTFDTQTLIRSGNTACHVWLWESDNPKALGIGVDENGCVVIEDGVATVLGKQDALFCEANRKG